MTGTGAWWWGYSAQTNQPSGSDANGNGGGTFDVENRMVSATINGANTAYAYDPWGKRISQAPVGTYPYSPTVYFYDVTGKKLQTYACTNDQGDGTPYCFVQSTNAFFGRKLIGIFGVANQVNGFVATDRLGSVRFVTNAAGGARSYYPYGEERPQSNGQTTPDGTEKFGTYFRDAIGQDYADQRYYNQAGRFFSPDPGGLSTADSADPTSWNRYLYVAGDPINFTDRAGRFHNNADTGEEEGEDFPAPDGPSSPPDAPVPAGDPTGDSSSAPGGIPQCPPLPTLPSGISSTQVQKNVQAAHDLYNAMLATAPDGALPALMGYFVGEFAPGGDWDYKKNYAPGTADNQNAKIFGNFNFGAVLASFGFSYNFTQNAAGIAQIAICISGGACGTGIPGLKYPFGDQVGDAVDIKKGFDYEIAKKAGCKD